MMNTLRLDSGFRVADFTTATGLPPSSLEPGIQHAVELGLLQVNDRIRTTPRGQRYLDELLQYWLPEQTADAGHA
jgi:coproporphyrinogen III oxidase-like Fe-S oxidoreductase